MVGPREGVVRGNLQSANPLYYLVGNECSILAREGRLYTNVL